MPRMTVRGHQHVGHASPTPNPFHKTSYQAGQDKVFGGGREVIRIGDTTSCGDPAVGGSTKVRAVGSFVHRFGDATGGHGSWVPNASAGGLFKVNIGT